MSTHTADLTPDPTKWSDRCKEFVGGVVAGAAAVPALCSIFVGVGADGGASPGAFGALGALGAVGFCLAGPYVASTAFFLPKKDRPVAEGLGVAFGLAVSLAVGAVAVNHISDRLEEEKKITAPAPANCNRDAVAKFAEDMKRKGYDVTLECR